MKTSTRWRSIPRTHLAAWVFTSLGTAGFAHAGLVATSATYVLGGNASSEGVFTDELITDSFSAGQSQPVPSPIGPYGNTRHALTAWQDMSFPSLHATGDAHASILAGGPSATQWSVSGAANVLVTGNFANGAIGRGHAWSQATMEFSLTDAVAYHFEGSVMGRADALVDPTWVNFAETAVVELWQGGTLLHTASGNLPGTPVSFDFSGIASAGTYRIEARAVARTESLDFGQPWGPSTDYIALFVIPAPSALLCGVCAAPIMSSRRRRVR